MHSFGGIGFVLWLLLGFCLSYMPLWFLPVHGIARLAVIAVIMFVPIVGDVLDFILWIVSFPIVLNGPQGGFAIAYYIIFAINIFFNIVPLALSVFPVICSLGEIKLIKPKYFSRETAPLRFLKVVKTLLKIGAGLQILFLVISIIPILGFLDKYGPGILIQYAIRIGVVILTIAASANLDDWKWRGVNLLYLWLFVACLLSAANQISQQGMQWSIVIGCFLGWLIWMVPMYIYFEKRRALFTPPIAAVPPETYAQQEAQMKQFVVDDATGEVISGPPAEEPKPVVLSYAPDFKLSGPPQPVVEPAPQDPPAPPSAPKKNSALYGVLIAICIASLAGNMVQGYLSVHKAQAHKDELAELQEEVRKQKGLVTGLKEACSDFRKNVQSLESKNREYRSYYDEHVFFNSNIGMIVNGSRYYHKYNCPIFEDADEYWAHNIEYCKYLGYSECPVCYNDDDVKFNITPKKLPPHLFYID